MIKRTEHGKTARAQFFLDGYSDYEYITDWFPRHFEGIPPIIKPFIIRFRQFTIQNSAFTIQNGAFIIQITIFIIRRRNMINSIAAEFYTFLIQ
nr:hypothetical protein [Ectobacillus panaciterrae]